MIGLNMEEREGSITLIVDSRPRSEFAISPRNVNAYVFPL